MTKISFISFAFLTFFGSSSFAQSDSIRYEVEVQTTATTEGTVPFWMRSNQYGAIPLSGVSTSVGGRAHKDYNHEPAENWYGNRKAVDWGAGFEGRANLGDGSNMILVEAYAKMRWTIFEIKAGRSKDVMGLSSDTSLSSGNFAVSGNALGVPKVEISIPEYWTLPFADGLFALKGNFAHGWVGSVPVSDFQNDVATYFHQKSLYGTIGKENWPVKFHGGLNHQVFWGNENEIFESDFELSKLGSFFHVLTGKAYGQSGTKVLRSKVGNHIGSIDVGVQYRTEKLSFFFYRQNFYDVGALAKLANIKDGLNGISISNLKNENKKTLFLWRKIVLELFHSKHQAGEFGSKYTQSGDENYYNNYIYPNGWSYLETGLGHPLITGLKDARDGLPSDPKDFFINNRVSAVHIGFEGEVGDIDIHTKITYSTNFGTFSTSPEGRTTGNLRLPPEYGIFGKKNQLSVNLNVAKSINSKYRAGLMAAYDHGTLLNNSIGLKASLTRMF